MLHTVYHHGISVRDLAAWRDAIAVLGFTAIEPGAQTPRHYRNVEGDQIGRYIAWWLGDEIRTHFIENPATGQQIDLVEIASRSLRPRRTDAPLEGDTTIGVPVDDPAAAYEAMRAAAPDLAFGEAVDAGEDGVGFTVEGQRMVLMPEGSPWTRVHYGAAGWPKARDFYTGVLGFALRPQSSETGAARFLIEDCGGRVEVEVSEATACPGEGDGKMYLGGNHFRLLNPDWEGIESRLTQSGLGSWLWQPRNGFAQIFGPSGESIELQSAE